MISRRVSGGAVCGLATGVWLVTCGSSAFAQTPADPATSGTPAQTPASLISPAAPQTSFEIAARFASGKQKGKQAGTWKPLDTRVQLIPGAVDKVLTFVQHNLTGSRVAATGANTWTIEWTAPQTPPAPVQFNVAANASNNDDSPLGDYIYLTMTRSTPAK